MLSKIRPEDLQRTNTVLDMFPPAMTHGDPDVHPLVWDNRGTLRWELDPLTDKMLRTGLIDLDLTRERLTLEEQCKLAKRMGYSLSGYWDLEYVQERIEQLEQQGRK